MIAHIYHEFLSIYFLQRNEKHVIVIAKVISGQLSKNRVASYLFETICITNISLRMGMIKNHQNSLRIIWCCLASSSLSICPRRISYYLFWPTIWFQTCERRTTRTGYIVLCYWDDIAVYIYTSNEHIQIFSE